MPRIDDFIRELRSHGAERLVIASGKPVTLTVEGGERRISAAELDHGEVESLLTEILPSEVSGETGRHRFHYDSEEGSVEVTVRRTDRFAQVLVFPLETGPGDRVPETPADAGPGGPGSGERCEERVSSDGANVDGRAGSRIQAAALTGPDTGRASTGGPPPQARCRCLRGSSPFRAHRSRSIVTRTGVIGPVRRVKCTTRWSLEPVCRCLEVCMKATIFIEPGRIELEDKPVPDVGPNDALVRVTTTTICGTDVHIVKGEYPVEKGLTIGHEPVGVIEKLGANVHGCEEGQRVIAGAICPSGYSNACLDGLHSQDGQSCAHGLKPLGGWRFGNTIDGAQAEYVRVPDAMANLSPVPDDLTDEQVLMCPDIMSTGFAGAERANIQIGDTVVVFAQGPIGLCATAGARLKGATTIIAVDRVPERLEMAREHGDAETIDYEEEDVYDRLMEMTGDRGPDRCIDAVGTDAHGTGILATTDRVKQRAKLEDDRPYVLREAIRCCRKGGTLSVPGVYVGRADDLPVGALMNKALTVETGQTHVQRYLDPLLGKIEDGEVDPSFVVSHNVALEEGPEMYETFNDKEDGCTKVVLTP
jgi:threonine dehydrogenase-like Zn-dependent dehydrogenase